MSEWASRISLCGNEMSLQSGAKLFKREDFVIEDHVFNKSLANIEFRCLTSKPTQFLQEAGFLFGITQSACKSDGCWFLNEKLGRQYRYLKCWLETARRQDLVSRYRVSNNRVFMVVKRARPRDEKMIYITEPHAQLYSFTRRPDGYMSTNYEDWTNVCQSNNVKLTKQTYKAFDYDLKIELVYQGQMAYICRHDFQSGT